MNVSDSIVNAQVRVVWLLHGPLLHCRKASFAFGVSVTVTTVPLVKHLFGPQVVGVGLTLTVPGPDGVTLNSTRPVKLAVTVAGAETLGEQGDEVPTQPPPLQPEKTSGEVAFSLTEAPAPGPKARQRLGVASGPQVANGAPPAQAIWPPGPTAFTWMFGHTFAPIVRGSWSSVTTHVALSAGQSLLPTEPLTAPLSKPTDV